MVGRAAGGTKIVAREMPMTPVTSRLVYATVFVTVLITPFAQAQNYPTRPIRMVIPFSPGGATDVPGRVLAQKLSEQFGQQVVVDNRPGAGSVVGTEVVAHAAPDGYTILMTGTPFAVSPAIYRKLPYHPVKDFAPVGQFGSAPNTCILR
jgi:tripartite-type tricarboxylate transporter receptor subunit TctC